MDFITAISKGSPIVIVAIILMFVLKSFFDSNSKEREKDRESRKQDTEKYNALVNKVQDESKAREERLMIQLDKYNSSLQEISENIKVIPQMQSDINLLKDKVINK